VRGRQQRRRFEAEGTLVVDRERRFKTTPASP
jgi:hypothetical protein